MLLTSDKGSNIIILEQRLKCNDTSEKEYDDAGGNDYERFNAEMFGRAYS